MFNKVIYGVIVFDGPVALIIKKVKEEEINTKTIKELEEIAEHTAGFYNLDYVIPSLFEGEIVWE